MTISLKSLQEPAERATQERCGNCIRNIACRNLICSLTEDSECDFSPSRFVVKAFTMNPSTALALIAVARFAKGYMNAPWDNANILALVKALKGIEE